MHNGMISSIEVVTKGGDVRDTIKTEQTVHTYIPTCNLFTCQQGGLAPTTRTTQSQRRKRVAARTRRPLPYPTKQVCPQAVAGHAGLAFDHRAYFTGDSGI